jgi:branched-chain amino acid transport system substrate-binding protein
MKLRIKAISLAAAVLGLVAACASENSTSPASGGSSSAKSPIAIGNIGTYSGADPLATLSGQGAIQAWAESVNAAGGIDGHPVKLYMEDDAGNAATSLTAMKRLVEQDHIVALVGEASQNSSGWQSYIQSEGIPVVGGNTTDLAFLTNPDFYSATGNVISNFYGITAVASQYGSKTGILYCAEAPVCKAASTIEQTLGKTNNVGLVYSASVSASASDFTANCVALKQSGAQSWNLSTASALQDRIAVQCKQLGFSAPLIQPGTTANSGKLSEPEFQGTQFVGNNLGYFVDSTPATKAFHAALAKYSPTVGSAAVPISDAAMASWTGGQLFLAAVQKSGAGTVTSANVKDGLYALRGDTLGGLAPPLTYVHGQANLFNCYFRYAIQDGKFVTPNGLAPICAHADGNAAIAAMAASLSK